MYLNLNTLLIVLPWQCLTTTWASAYLNSDESGYQIYDNDTYPMSPINQTRFLATQLHDFMTEPPIGRHYNPKDCHIPMSDVNFKMPIPFTHETKPPTTIYPDRNGFLNMRHGDYFKLSCTNRDFTWPQARRKTEITVMCLNETFLLFENQTIPFDEFQCRRMPKVKFVITSKKCQGNNNTFVARIGFQTRYSFMNLFRVCFDNETKTTLYAWYQLETPKSYRYQMANWSEIMSTPFFPTTSYDKINMSEVYNNQKKSVIKILKSEMLANYYIVKEPGEVRFLAPGYLINQREFPYNYQQKATAFYENTTPMWYKFHMITWRRIQEAVDLILLRKTSKRFLVVAGTYGTFALHDEKVLSRRVFLYLPNTLKVPKFIWKMVYNYNLRKGTVFIGLNTAFQTHIKEKRICKASMCPGFPSRDEFDRAFIYCCSKDSFEATYGRLDPYLYQKFY